MTVYIIPCSGPKLSHPAPAARLYTGSLFLSCLRAARAAVEYGDQIFILSALHGLVALEQVVAPYECHISSKQAISPELLAVQAQLLGMSWATDVYAFLPKDYFRKLDQALRTFDCLPHYVYEGSERGIGDMRKVHRHITTN